jgi:hypothetical protein
MNAGTGLAVVMALAVGGGVGLWIRRGAADAADEARLAELDRESERVRREKAASPARGAPVTRNPAPGAPKPPPPSGTVKAPEPNQVRVLGPWDVPTPGEPEPGPPKHSIEGHEAMLKVVDWNIVGRNLAALLPALSEFATSAAKSGEMAPDLRGRLGELNGPVLAASIKAREKIGARDANAVFTHPAFAVNAIAATLEAAGKPLAEEQGASLAKIAKLYADREKARVDGEGPLVFAVARTIEEAALRDDFFAAAREVLKPEQRAILWHEGARDRLGVDPFSSGLLWSSVARPLPFKDRDVLVDNVTDLLVTPFELPEDRRPIARDAAVAFVNGMPAAELEHKVEVLSAMGMIPTPSVRDTAKRWLTALERIVREGRLDEETVARIRGSPTVPMPIRVE